ncbi:putative mitochondrial hypothetical protein [Leptomonas pyrrhocoris]|uniref:Uncharacterized protein n=1 Tax=Leptomonas pyrrhocoris TaxID=157538 RepID=A0A0M9G856_LEPPY|nr:putative mitochondrial hypothetical protein [Leptomonas pyrrhocoris]XP_015662849.1 putative mitochondrial hypothetical protein [Leptomonas pyrrhocoris]KPA84409.1 putative mitochondrial hypothetical protein [Leptomonas pyrrhocoris]KPA84410.1 putative mitochondrial hypothetical protein [Leptomonas pyrrhocoris]|eukprot:XP_015662848.1 putative mitochondrial hypothetical protein [Leptomonas pyrrhocoris]
MASSANDKDKKKSGHRRTSAPKSGDKNGATPTRDGSARKSSASRSAANPQLPRQNSSHSANMSAMPKASRPALAAAAAPSSTRASNGAPPSSTRSAPRSTVSPTRSTNGAAPPPTTGINARRSSAPVAPNAPGGAPTACGGAAPGPQPNAMGGGYGIMGPGGYESMGNYSYNSMGPTSMGPGGMTGDFGSMVPGGMMSGGAGGGMNPYGSMGPVGMNPYGSMGPGGYGGMATGGGGDGGMNGGYGSMVDGEGGVMGGAGDMNGGGYGSVYGGAPGSMYYNGMGGPMGGFMYYGMGAPMMGGSMYGMGGNSMYGGMNSMYGMGGGGSMYGMESMYGLGRYNSMGLGSTYASMYGLGRTSSRASFRSSGGYVGGSFGGLWRAPSGDGRRAKKDYSIPPPSSKLSEAFPDNDKADEPPREQTGKRGLTAASKEDEKKAVPAAAADQKEEKKATTPSVVVVDNAGSKDDKAKSRSVPLALASSHRLTKQVNDNVHVVAIAPSESVANKADKTVTVGSTTYTMDEVAVGAVDVEKSDLLTDIVEQTQCGHNVSLLVLCGRQKYEASTPPVTAVVRSMMDTFAADDTQVTQVVASAVVFTAPDKIVDLLLPDGETAEPVKAELGSNPIYGPCVMNTSEKKVETAEAAVGVVEVAARMAKQRGLVVVTYKIKQIRPAAGHSTSRNVYVSSMLVAMVDDTNMVHVRAAEKHGTAGPTPLFCNAIGGASRTVAIVQIPATGAETSVGDALANALQLREIKNTPTRSGNVKRFVDYTERAAAANAKTSPETAAKINRMLKDAKELLAKPDETPLVAYNLYGGGHAPSPASTREEAKKSGATPQTVQSRDAPAVVSATAAVEDDDAKPEQERRVKLTVCVDGTTAMLQGEADEVVMRATPEEVPESAMLKSLRANFRYGRNVALVSAETQSSVELPKQYTWSCVDSILSKCLRDPIPGAATTAVELFMVVVQKRQVLCDLMAEGSTVKPLAIASSPLFGPIIADTQHKTLRAAAEVRPALEKALAAAPPHLKEMDAMIVMTAVLKQPQASGDVAVASFMCASGPSGAGVRGAMSKNPDYSRSLFAYAIGGPCVTTLLVSVGDDHATNAAAKSSLEDLLPLTKQPNHASRDGSVNNFLDYAKKRMAANENRMEQAATAEEKERLKVASSRLQMMHGDYSALVQSPQDNTPAYYIGEKRVSEVPRVGGKPVDETPAAATSNDRRSSPESGQQAPVPIRSVVVVVNSSTSNDGGAAAKGGSVMEVTEKEVVLDGEHYAPTEVVASQSGTLRSAVIDEVHKVALNGYNAAILTNDVAGSTVGISMVVKTVVVILRGLTPGSEAFWTVVVSKDNKVKDMLADNSPYYDLHLASSPLFGNVAYGANISPVAEAQVEPMVREVRNEVRENGGVGYICVILRITQPDGDVCMPSFLATIAGDNVDEYEELLRQRGSSSSRLLSTALGGPCHTIYVAGLRGPSGAGAKPLLELANKVTKVRNAPLRSCSLRRFIVHTEPTLAGMERKLEAGNGPNQALEAQIGRIGTMLKDARNMLSSPGGSAPAVYKR